MKLLILESDTEMASRRLNWFMAQHYLVEVQAVWQTALESVMNKVDVILLGALTDISGPELVRNYRRTGGRTPILIISGQDSAQVDASKVELEALPKPLPENALDSGADDFVTTNCPLAELSARVRALLRRPPAVFNNNFLQVGDILFDAVTGTVIKDNVEVYLQPMEMNLLEFFLRHPNQIFTAHALHERIWRARITRGTDSDTVRTHIKTLRKKIDRPGEPSIISLVPGEGYSLIQR